MPKVRPQPTQSNLRIFVSLFLFTLLVYLPAARFSFVNFDDPVYVTQNAGGVFQAFTTTVAANWIPLTRLSHLLDATLFGMNAGAHHLMNVFIHACAAMILFAFLNRATHIRWPGAFVAFVFALHPLHVESVAWVSERKDVLCAFFWFLTLYAYVLYAERTTLKRYLLVLLFFCLGLLAKPMIVTLPFLLLLLDRWPLQRTGFLLREKLPFFVLSIAAAIVTYAVQQASGAVRTTESFPLHLRIENALVSCIVYIGQMLWPAKLAVFYPFPSAIPVWQAAVSAAAILGVSLLALRFARKYPWFPVGWFWFLITLAPVIGLVQVGAQSRADRYMYVPMVGLTIAIAWSAGRWIRPLAGALCAACFVATWFQIQYWKDSESLFTHAIAVTKDNYLAEHNLGDALLDIPGRLPDAVSHLQTSLQMRPDSVSAHTDLGNALARLPGRMPDAIAQYQEALRLDPNSSIPRENLAHAQAETADFHYNLALSLAKSGDSLPEAIAEFETALRLRPDFAEAHNNLGVTLSHFPNRLPEAISHFEAALRIRPDYAEAHYNLGVAFSNLPGRLKQALAQFEEAERLQPDPETRQIIERLRDSRL